MSVNSFLSEFEKRTEQVTVCGLPIQGCRRYRSKVDVQVAHFPHRGKDSIYLAMMSSLERGKGHGSDRLVRQYNRSQQARSGLDRSYRKHPIRQYTIDTSSLKPRYRVIVRNTAWPPREPVARPAASKQRFCSQCSRYKPKRDSLGNRVPLATAH
jgi:hypothetical protein